MKNGVARLVPPAHPIFHTVRSAMTNFTSPGALEPGSPGAREPGGRAGPRAREPGAREPGARDPGLRAREPGSAPRRRLTLTHAPHPWRENRVETAGPQLNQTELAHGPHPWRENRVETARPHLN